MYALLNQVMCPARAGAGVAVEGLPALTGAAVGALFAALNRFGMRRFWAAPRAPLNVVVTGGTRGIGKAVAREFLLCVPYPKHLVWLALLALQLGPG